MVQLAITWILSIAFTVVAIVRPDRERAPSCNSVGKANSTTVDMRASLVGWTALEEGYGWHKRTQKLIRSMLLYVVFPFILAHHEGGAVSTEALIAVITKLLLNIAFVHVTPSVLIRRYRVQPGINITAMAAKVPQP